LIPKKIKDKLKNEKVSRGDKIHEKNNKNHDKFNGDS